MTSNPDPVGTAPLQDPSPEEKNEASSENHQLPLLPAPEHSEGSTQLPVDGGAVKLDHLGPLVVHQDGTVSRIANWAEMAEIEKENTLRVLGKRNKLRLDKLKKEQADGGDKNV